MGLAVDPNDPTHAYIVNTSFQGSTLGQASVKGLVFETHNSGGAWTDVSGNLPNYPVYTIAIDQNFSNTLYIGNDLGVFVTTNDGTSWSQYGTGLPHSRVWQLVTGKQGELAVGTHGRSLWETSTTTALTINTLPSTPPAVPGDQPAVLGRMPQPPPPHAPLHYLAL